MEALYGLLPKTLSHNILQTTDPIMNCLPILPFSPVS